MPEHAFGVGFESASEDNFVLPSRRIFAADFIVILCEIPPGLGRHARCYGGGAEDGWRATLRGC